MFDTLTLVVVTAGTVLLLTVKGLVAPAITHIRALDLSLEMPAEIASTAPTQPKITILATKRVEPLTQQSLEQPVRMERASTRAASLLAGQAASRSYSDEVSRSIVENSPPTEDECWDIVPGKQFTPAEAYPFLVACGRMTRSEFEEHRASMRGPR